MIQQRISLVREIRDRLQSHPFCQRLEESADWLLVKMPEGPRIRVSCPRGKAVAMTRLLIRLEHEWKLALFKPCPTLREYDELGLAWTPAQCLSVSAAALRGDLADNIRSIEDVA